MLKGHTQLPIHTIISAIPITPNALKGKPLTVKVKWENGVPAYFAKYDDNYGHISALDLLECINARLRFLPAPISLITGLVISITLAFNASKETAIGYLLIGFFLSFLTALVIHKTGLKKRRITVNYEDNEEGRLVTENLKVAMKTLEKVAQVWDFSSQQNVTIKPIPLQKITCDVPAISFFGIRPKVFWMPDQLYIFTGRKYQTYAYSQIIIEGSTYRTEQNGKLPPDARILSQRWLHQRKDGQADQRYKENYKISQVEYGTLSFSTATETLFKLGISNCGAVIQVANAFRTLAQSKPVAAKKASIKYQPPPPPTVNNRQRQASSAQQENVKDVIYPLTPSSKEVIYPLTVSRETKEEQVGRNDYKQFLQDAQKYYSRMGEPCEAVGFINYRPTYASLNERQMRWYFYWRAEARKDHYLPTDTSYLFLHAYEILNLVEKKDPIEAADYLKRLLAIYGKENKEINRYFPEWSGDLIAEKIGVENALVFWSKLKDEAYFSADLINTLVQRAATKNYLPQLPWAIWYRLTDFGPNNKRLQEHFAAEQIVEAHFRAIALADVYWRKKAGKSVVEQFTKGEVREIYKPLFQSAVIGRNHQQTILLGFAQNYVGNQELGKHLASIMKEAENVLWKRAGITSGLLETDLDSELKEIINRFLQLAPNKHEGSFPPIPDKKNSIPLKLPTDSSRIKIDLTRVEELQRESENLSHLLGDASAETQEKPLKQDWHLSSLIKTNDLTTRNFENTHPPQREQPKSAPKRGLEINLVHVEELQRESDEISLLLASEDEWQDLAVSQNPLTRPQAEAFINVSDPADEWSRLFACLTQAEKELLKDFAKSDKLSEKHIQAIALKYRTMALIDGLCEKASEIFERDLIFSEGDHWTMEDDELETLQLKLKEIERT